MYKDIINLPYPNPEIERDFPEKVNRAAQFAAFAALTGFDDSVEETARFTGKRIELDENAKEELNRMLREIIDNPKHDIEVAVTLFVPDEKKEGGEYVSIKGRIKKFRQFENEIVMQDGTMVNIEDIIHIECI